MPSIEKLMLVQITMPSPTRQHIAEVAKGVKAILAENTQDSQLAFASADGSSFAFFVKTSLSEYHLAKKIWAPGGDTLETAKPSLLYTGDSLLVIEISGSFVAVGNTKASSWVHARLRENRSQERASTSDASTQPSQLADQLAKLKGKL